MTFLSFFNYFLDFEAMGALYTSFFGILKQWVHSIRHFLEF